MYMDPVLQAHMSEQGPLLAGRCLLDFIHEEEQESARNDLRQTLGEGGLTGSITRCVFDSLLSPSIRIYFPVGYRS